MIGFLEIVLFLAGMVALVLVVVMVAKFSGHKPMDYPPQPELPKRPPAGRDR